MLTFGLLGVADEAALPPLAAAAAEAALLLLLPLAVAAAGLDKPGVAEEAGERERDQREPNQPPDIYIYFLMCTPIIYTAHAHVLSNHFSRMMNPPLTYVTLSSWLTQTNRMHATHTHTHSQGVPALCFGPHHRPATPEQAQARGQCRPWPRRR